MGMHVIYLPYADDLRGEFTSKTFLDQSSAGMSWISVDRLLVSTAPNLNPLLAVDRPVVDATKKLVESMTVEKFDCRDYHNPALQKHYKNLQTLALEEEVDEGVVNHSHSSKLSIEQNVGFTPGWCNFKRTFREMFVVAGR